MPNQRTEHDDTTPIEQLQGQEGRAANRAQESVERDSSGQSYAVDKQIAEMEAGWQPPPETEQPARPGVQDLAAGGTAWLADTEAESLTLYERPGYSGSNTMVQLGRDEQVSVLESQQVEGAAWVCVRTARGHEGWVPSERLRAQK